MSGLRLLGGGEDTFPFLVDGDPSTCADSGPRGHEPSFKIDLGAKYLVERVGLVFPTGCGSTISKTGCE